MVDNVDANQPKLAWLFEKLLAASILSRPYQETMDGKQDQHNYGVMYGSFATTNGSVSLKAYINDWVQWYTSWLGVSVCKHSLRWVIYCTCWTGVVEVDVIRGKSIENPKLNSSIKLLMWPIFNVWNSLLDMLDLLFFCMYSKDKTNKLCELELVQTLD